MTDEELAELTRAEPSWANAGALIEAMDAKGWNLQIIGRGARFWSSEETDTMGWVDARTMADIPAAVAEAVCRVVGIWSGE